MRRPISSSWVPRLDSRARSLLVLMRLRPPAFQHPCGTDRRLPPDLRLASHGRSFSRGANSAGRSRGARYDEPLPMLARVELRGSADVRAALARPRTAGDDVAPAVAEIIAEVRTGG